ncbi:MAG: hypothetical protein LBQ66_02805 [Planctomycetaceae bacterium]|nr:hypothetical protein [Planctomycetaceae bacterium]
MAVFLFLWGTVLLVFRVGGVDTGILSYCLSLVIFIPLCAIIFAVRRIPHEGKLVSIIDKENGAGGLVMSSFETDIGNWSEQVKTLNAPVVRWIPNRAIGLFLSAVLFAITSFLLPISVISDQLPRRLNIDDQVNRMTTQLDTMEKEKLLEQVEVESLKRELKLLQKEADGLGPIKTFDALDTLSDKMNREVAKTVQDAGENAKSLAEAESLMKKVKEVSQTIDAQTSKSLMEGLAESMENMFAENKQLADALQDELDDEQAESENQNNDENKPNDNENNSDQSDKQNDQNKKDENQKQEDNKDGEKKNDSKSNDALKKELKKMLAENNMRNLSPEMMEMMAEAMRNCAGKCERKIGNLQKAGFKIDKEALERIANNRREAKEEAERMLSDLWANCDGNCDGGECDGGGGERESEVSPRYTQAQDWRTDPNAGPGKTRFQKGIDDEGFEFKAETLPAADLQAFKDSLKLGVTKEKPTSNSKNKLDTNGGAINETGDGAGSAHMQNIYPKHRRPVGRFFEK